MMTPPTTTPDLCTLLYCTSCSFCIVMIFSFVIPTSLISYAQWMQLQVKQYKWMRNGPQCHIRTPTLSFFLFLFYFLFFLFSFWCCFSQKRAKKLEGETLYVRHSNLMLEVGIRLRSELLSLLFDCLPLHAVSLSFSLFLSLSRMLEVSSASFSLHIDIFFSFLILRLLLFCFS